MRTSATAPIAREMTMIADESVQKLLATVRIYADADAFQRDQFGRTEYLHMKPTHDELYQVAISSKPASSLLLLQRRPPLSLPEGFTVGCARPRWRPANISPTKSDLLIAPVAAFQRSWRGLRAIAEARPKDVPLWHDDPALVFESKPGVFLCRSACVGHEGQVIYFVYRHERAWKHEIETRGMRPIGEGEACYRMYIPVPGKYAE